MAPSTFTMSIRSKMSHSFDKSSISSQNIIRGRFPAFIQSSVWLIATSSISLTQEEPMMLLREKPGKKTESRKDTFLLGAKLSSPISVMLLEHNTLLNAFASPTAQLPRCGMPSICCRSSHNDVPFTTYASIFWIKPLISVIGRLLSENSDKS